MPYQSVFKRYELKYLLTREQEQSIRRVMEDYMVLDQYGRTNIRNLYFDTENYRLIRKSLEKPVYKEKLRLRSYGDPKGGDVFVELKKKYDSVVYKRRIAMPEQQALVWLYGGTCNRDSQIIREIGTFLDFYGTLEPRVFLSYDRDAFYAKDRSDLRITFDDNILCRQERLHFRDVDGTPILDPELVLMEIKTGGGIPLWLTHALSVGRIYKTTFSKYGTAYQTMIFKGAFHHVG